MELQWPLIIFTTLIAWSAGLFATQCVYALKGEAPKAQIPAWIASAALLVVGGIAVFFHLEHWTRIFNGFGHLSSGITQELIAIVVLAVIAVIYVALLRKGDGKVPAWIAVLGIVAAAVLIVVMAHSYMMAARPAWDTPVFVLAVLGNALAFGPATFAVICNTQNDSTALEGVLVLVGTIANAVTSVLYLVVASMAQFFQIDYYFDPVHPTYALTGVASPFGSLIAPTLICMVLAVVAVVCAVMGKKKGDWKTFGGSAVACVLVSAVLLRVVFYGMGASVWTLF